MSKEIRKTLDRSKRRASKEEDHVLEGWMLAFCSALQTNRSVANACDKASVDLKRAYAARNRSPAFRKAWMDAQMEFDRRLETLLASAESDEEWVIVMLRTCRPETYGD